MIRNYRSFYPGKENQAERHIIFAQETEEIRPTDQKLGVHSALNMYSSLTGLLGLRRDVHATSRLSTRGTQQHKTVEATVVCSQWGNRHRRARKSCAHMALSTKAGPASLKLLLRQLPVDAAEVKATMLGYYSQLQPPRHFSTWRLADIRRSAGWPDRSARVRLVDAFQCIALPDSGLWPGSGSAEHRAGPRCPRSAARSRDQRRRSEARGGQSRHSCRRSRRRSRRGPLSIVAYDARLQHGKPIECGQRKYE